MTKEMQRHRHIGAYGICLRDNRLLVVRKGRGPYTGRYDLPGGRVENNEGVFDTLYREFQEETGCHAVNVQHLGVWDCQLTWEEEGYDPILMHHITLMFGVDVEMEPNPQANGSHDSLGALWIPLDACTQDNSSPLVTAAKHYAKTGSLPLQTQVYETWTVLGETE